MGKETAVQGTHCTWWCEQKTRASPKQRDFGAGVVQARGYDVLVLAVQPSHDVLQFAVSVKRQRARRGKVYFKLEHVTLRLASSKGPQGHMNTRRLVRAQQHSGHNSSNSNCCSTRHVSTEPT